jgi:hypothetical protein
MTFSARAGNFFQAFDRAIDEVVVHGNLERDLSQQVRLVLVSAVGFELTPLPRVTHGVADGHPRYIEPRKCLLHGVELGRLDYGKDHFHGN